MQTAFGASVLNVAGNMKTKRILFNTLFVIIGIIALILFLWGAIAFGQDKGGPGCDKTCQERFRKEWRQLALATLRVHFDRHGDCDLRQAVSAIENMQIFFSTEMPARQNALAFPDAEATHPMILINADLKWVERDGIILLVHESTHLARSKHGRGFLCGADKQRPGGNATPACRLFGKVQYNSDDINRDIEKHLWP